MFSSAQSGCVGTPAVATAVPPVVVIVQALFSIYCIAATSERKNTYFENFRFKFGT